MSRFTAAMAREKFSTELDDILRDIVESHADKREADWNFMDGMFSFTALEAINGAMERGFKIQINSLDKGVFNITISW